MAEERESAKDEKKGNANAANYVWCVLISINILWSNSMVLSAFGFLLSIEHRKHTQIESMM